MRAVFAAAVGAAVLCGCAPKAAVEKGPAPQAQAPAPVPAKTPVAAVLVTTRGTIRIAFFPDSAPKTTAYFVELSTRPFLNGAAFERVMPGLLIESGLPAVSTSAAAGVSFEEEPSALRKFDKAGLVALASPGPNANDGRFFITLAPAPWLDRKHPVFGEVAGGLDAAIEISKAARDADDRPLQPVVIREVRIEYR